MRVYLDTNILVDLVFSRQEFLLDAQRVFALGYAGDVQLMVSALSFVNTVYLGRKYKFPMDEVCSKLRLIADFVDVLDLRGQNVVDRPHDIRGSMSKRLFVMSDSDVDSLTL
jgi:predicted nucleic acid-binding protein